MCHKKRTCCGVCYPKSLTDNFDLFAQPVYQFTFRDSYVVSTCCGSLCTIALFLGIVFVMFSKVMVFLDGEPNNFTVTELLEYGQYPVETVFDRHQIAIGLAYKEQYQDKMDKVLEKIDFTDYLDTLVDIQMFTLTKKDGVMTKSDPLVLDPCSTLDLNRFYTPRTSSDASFQFLQKYKPMQCLDESANLKLKPSWQESSQVLDGVAANDRVKASRGGQDVSISGDTLNRHSDKRELLFQINPCTENAATKKRCNPKA